MRRYAWLAAIGVCALPSLAHGQTQTAVKQYSMRTSIPEGKATCLFNVTVEDAAGEVLTFTLRPGAESATTGENGGEIRLREPIGTASAGHEDACDAWPDSPATAATPIDGARVTLPVVFQLHSHPDDNCQARGVARGNIRMTVDSAAAIITTGPTICDVNEGRGNLRTGFRRRRGNITTGARERVTTDITNHGPGHSTNTTFTTTLPEPRAWIVSATVNSEPCSIGTIPGPPVQQHRIVCDLGDLPPDMSKRVDVVFVPRRTGSFETTLAVGADNNGVLFDPDRTVMTNVSQGVSRTLALTVKGRNGGGGTVNVNPAGGSTPANCTHPDPGNAAATKTQCLHFYDPNTAVTLTATPQAGSAVTWSGACSGTGATCSLTMDGDKSVDARFTK